MVYVKNVIREMFQKTYVIRDLNENRLVIRDRAPPPLTTLFSLRFSRLPRRLKKFEREKILGANILNS